MQLERCENGHMYNSTRFSECPYCKIDDNDIIDEQFEEEKLIVPDQIDENEKTIAYWVNEQRIEPVVGWLTCIKGEDIGKDFKIVSEKNYIGRADEMHITINGDNTISRKNHVIIVYNPKQRNFMLIPGEGTGLVYLNNDALYAPRELKSYDVIEIGNTKFVFIALCGEHFDWDLK